MLTKKVIAMKRCILGLFIGLVFWGCNADTEPDPEMPYYDIDSYEYLDVPAQADRVVWQIPIDTVKRMTTKALVQAILDYPLFFEVLTWAGHYYQRNFEVFYGDNNAFNELIRRNDRGKVLLERLIDNNPVSSQDYNKQYQELLFELLIAQVLIEDVKTLQSIVRIALQRYELRQKDPETSYLFVYRDITFVLISRAMLAANYAPYVREVNKNQYLKYYTDGWIPKDVDPIYPEYPYVDRAFEYRYHLAELDSYRQIIHAYGIIFLKLKTK